MRTLRSYRPARDRRAGWRRRAASDPAAPDLAPDSLTGADHRAYNTRCPRDPCPDPMVVLFLDGAGGCANIAGFFLGIPTVHRSPRRPAEVVSAARPASRCRNALLE